MKKKKELILGVSLIVIIIAMAIVLVIINKDDKKEFEDVQVTTTVEESTKANDSNNTFMEETIIKCCYELRYIFAINEFDDISTVYVNKLAQYGLCHLYYNSLLDIPASDELEYRDASKKDIEAVLKSQFNVEGLNLEESDIYNKAEQKFEMWVPNYSQQITYDYTVTDNGDNLTINVVYYEDEIRSKVKSEATINVAKEGDLYYIKSLH